jgi:hypothetical protein
MKPRSRETQQEIYNCDGMTRTEVTWHDWPDKRQLESQIFEGQSEAHFMLMASRGL